MFLVREDKGGITQKPNQIYKVGIVSSCWVLSAGPAVTTGYFYAASSSSVTVLAAARAYAEGFRS